MSIKIKELISHGLAECKRRILSCHYLERESNNSNCLEGGILKQGTIEGFSTRTSTCILSKILGFIKLDKEDLVK